MLKSLSYLDSFLRFEYLFLFLIGRWLVLPWWTVQCCWFDAWYRCISIILRCVYLHSDLLVSWVNQNLSTTDGLIIIHFDNSQNYFGWFVFDLCLPFLFQELLVLCQQNDCGYHILCFSLLQVICFIFSKGIWKHEVLILQIFPQFLFWNQWVQFRF